MFREVLALPCRPGPEESRPPGADEITVRADSPMQFLGNGPLDLCLFAFAPPAGQFLAVRPVRLEVQEPAVVS
eukprot:6393493-Pyramimonas_sp.AAC.1